LGWGEGFAYSFEEGERVSGAWETEGREKGDREREKGDRGRETGEGEGREREGREIFIISQIRRSSLTLSVPGQTRGGSQCLQLFSKYFWVHHSINERHTQKYIKKS
jgi:hypothetical protein